MSFFLLHVPVSASRHEVNNVSVCPSVAVNKSVAWPTFTSFVFSLPIVTAPLSHGAFLALSQLRLTFTVAALLSGSPYMMAGGQALIDARAILRFWQGERRETSNAQRSRSSACCWRWRTLTGVQADLHLPNPNFWGTSLQPVLPRRDEGAAFAHNQRRKWKLSTSLPVRCAACGQRPCEINCSVNLEKSIWVYSVELGFAAWLEPSEPKTLPWPFCPTETRDTAGCQSNLPLLCNIAQSHFRWEPLFAFQTYWIHLQR